MLENTRITAIYCHFFAGCDDCLGWRVCSTSRMSIIDWEQSEAFFDDGNASWQYSAKTATANRWCCSVCFVAVFFLANFNAITAAGGEWARFVGSSSRTGRSRTLQKSMTQMTQMTGGCICYARASATARPSSRCFSNGLTPLNGVFILIVAPVIAIALSVAILYRSGAFRRGLWPGGENRECVRLFFGGHQTHLVPFTPSRSEGRQWSGVNGGPYMCERRAFFRRVKTENK